MTSPAPRRGETATGLRDAFEETLGEHFVMWHALEGDGPAGEWQCQCGLKFGFSASAIAHQSAVLLALPEVSELRASARVEALTDARRQATRGPGWGPPLERFEDRLSVATWLAALASSSATEPENAS